ncbi:Werner helicase interacting protein-like protein, partial [Nadsonia fulvescens var. elongata DSM 6958]
PLAELARPKYLDDFVGQKHILGRAGCLTSYIEEDRCPSIILWGPPGIGKTTIARIIARATQSRFVELSATYHGINECRLIFKQAIDHKKLTGQKTILFLDEIHRFNKGQQDIFLPVVESGDIILVGATTDNPSFRIIKALTSRCQVLTLNKLTQSDIHQILIRASDVYNRQRDQNGLTSINVTDDVFLYLSGIADGDSRSGINLLEMAMKYIAGTEANVSLEDIKKALVRSHVIYDRAGDAHYDLISAFHKAIRGSNADAAVFYLMRMIQGGEDPLYIARRMTRIASEDIGLADESCLTMALSTFAVINQLGMPEADCAMVQCCMKLATAPKSVLVYRAMNRAKAFCAKPENIAKKVPPHMSALSTALVKELGNKSDIYKYNPDYLNGEVQQNYMPEGLEDVKFIDNMHLGTKIDHDLERSKS